MRKGFANGLEENEEKMGGLEEGGKGMEVWGRKRGDLKEEGDEKGENLEEVKIEEAMEKEMKL